MSFKKYYCCVLFISVFLLCIVAFLFSCKDPIQPERELYKQTTIFVLTKNTNSKYILKYSEIENIKFKDTPISISTNTSTGSAFPSLYLDEKRNCIIIVIQKKLVFVDLKDFKIIGELEIPDTNNPETYISYGELKIFPCFWDKDYCILVNRSIFLIDLERRSIRNIIWKSADSTYSIYIHNCSLSNSGEDIYMQLTYYKYTMFQKLVKLNLLTGMTSVIHEFSEKIPGAKRVFCTDDYIISYSPNENKILKYSISDDAFIDSCILNVKFSNSGYNLYRNKLLIHHFENSNLYSLDCNEYSSSLYMNNNYGRIIRNRFHKMNSGDLYDVIIATDDGKSIINNLTKKSKVNEFQIDDGPYDLVIKEVLK